MNCGDISNVSNALSDIINAGNKNIDKYNSNANWEEIVGKS